MVGLRCRLCRGCLRNAPCPCGSGRKYKRCCADALEHPARVARAHDAVGERIREWAFEHHHDAIDAALAEIVAGRKDLVVGDADLALIATWTLSDRELPEGDTLAERYARRPDLPAAERDVAHRIASARLGVFCVMSVQPGRWIELDELSAGPTTRVLSHDISRTVRRDDMLVGRLMAGPPSPSLWGPVANLTSAIGRELVDRLRAHARAQGVPDDPAAFGTLMRSASREITTLLAPGLARSAELDRAA